MKPFQLVLAQITVIPGDPGRNLERAEKALDRARSLGAEVVVLPEALDCGWTHPCALDRAEGIPEGTGCRRLSRAARTLGLCVAAGLVEREPGPSGRLFNSAVLLGPDGSVLHRHRKIHELDFARRLYATGTGVGVVETAWGRFGLMICADAFAVGMPHSRGLGRLGAEVILSPCAWAVPADHDPERTPYGQLWLDHYGPVAREYGLWIAGCSNVGPVTAGEWAGWRCIGCSLVVGPDGEARARGPYGVGAEVLIGMRVGEPGPVTLHAVD